MAGEKGGDDSNPSSAGRVACSISRQQVLFPSIRIMLRSQKITNVLQLLELAEGTLARGKNLFRARCQGSKNLYSTTLSYVSSISVDIDSIEYTRTCRKRNRLDSTKCFH